MEGTERGAGSEERRGEPTVGSVEGRGEAAAAGGDMLPALRCPKIETQSEGQADL